MSLALRELRRVLRGPTPLSALRQLAYPEPRPDPPQRSQLALWVVDGPGLPQRPWRVHPDLAFRCEALGCDGVLVRTCVARQLATDAQRTRQSSRGQGTEYPSCDTRKCLQGRGIRAALGPSAGITWDGAWVGGRFQRERSRVDARGQDRARDRLDRAGLLDPVRTLDVDEDPTEEA